MTSASFNLYQALCKAFPSDLGSTALETDNGLRYTWSDLDAGSAKLANFLQSLDLPSGARMVVQLDPSVEALMLYLASLRTGLVYVPLGMSCQSAEMADVIEDAAPVVLVCSASHFGWVSKLAFQAGTAWVFTLNNDRTGSLLERAAQAPDQHSPAVSQAGELVVITYTSGTTDRVAHTHADMLCKEVMLPLPGLGLSATQVLTRLQTGLARVK